VPFAIPTSTSAPFSCGRQLSLDAYLRSVFSENRLLHSVFVKATAAASWWFALVTFYLARGGRGSLHVARGLADRPEEDKGHL